jgi:anti-sigma factor ChrR (cupin superfamily)
MEPELCLRARRSFSDHMDGQPLPWRDRILVALHLRICPLCRRVQRSLDATCDALGALRDHDPESRGGADRP